MIVYNCLQSCETSLPCFIDNFSDSFLPLLCDSLTIVKDQDWIILCISEHFLSIETFLPIIFTYGSSNCRCNVLDVLIHSLDEETPDHVLDFMTKQFQVQSDLIALSESPETLDNAVLTVKVLEFLCVASSRDGHDRKFLADGNLLSTVVGVLRKVTAAGKSETSGEFGLSQIRSPPVGSVELSDNPVAGFKSSLIRVIGNLCYRCPENQTKVRELGGIGLVLEHFNLDDNNPFIQQWSVLAIRNICEGNVENQEVVTAYERLTAAESPILQRPGVALELKPPSVNPEPYT
uniref:Ataxin-10 n=1 Tax=Phallusia mammillata TaxID=59560 RepID=A0A6F9D7T3_9ASCI|nr:ataxin-10-like [Phallusia mammillata]